MVKSAKYDLIKKWYDKNLWTAEMVKNAVAAKWITQEECDEILYKH
jgi:hypothetical protein